MSVNGSVTERIVQTARCLQFEALPEDVVVLAKHCLLDWVGVAIAGSQQPLASLLLAEAQEQGGDGAAAVLGTPLRTTPLMAALVNGAASHALDYDDVHLMMPGHPSVPVYPALLALAEAGQEAPGHRFLTAFVAGLETECRVGGVMAPGHYRAGWHATATLGALGAAAACAHYLGLTEEQWRHALGIAGALASGLKSMFGTMTKPLQAGKAALNGLLAARLAARGFTADAAVLDSEQGFCATHTDTLRPQVLDRLEGGFAIRDVLFKYHAACYGTHASIEAALRLRERHGISPEQVREVRLRVPEVNMGICNIPSPRTGLEGKFSMRFTTALALAGWGTDEAAFNDASVREPSLVSLMERVHVEADPEMRDSCSEVTVTLADGTSLSEFADVSRPCPDLDLQWRRLTAKFRGLVSPVLGEERAEALIEAIARVEGGDVREIARLCQP
mgnify:CR=1 FL=1|jgi:2-methylcitrate dehydratase PrpD